MAILAFQKPDKVIMIQSTDNEGKFEFRPLEPGYGITIGNSLRRILLGSLEGFAITSIRIFYNKRSCGRRYGDGSKFQTSSF
jgi:DNA-directed RNA polymerase subunit alpha